MKRKKKLFGLLTLTALLIGCKSTPVVLNEEQASLQSRLNPSIKKQSATGYSTDNNYHSTGYPSVYGYETHVTDKILLNMGTNTTLPANDYGYNDTGVKIYGNKTSTNVGSTNTILINESCPFVDLTDIHWFVPYAISSKMTESIATLYCGLLSFKVEIFDGSYRKFIAEANTNIDSNFETKGFTYNKNGSITIESYDSNNPTKLDVSKLGKLSTSLYTGTYSIKVTYSYSWMDFDATSPMNSRLFQETATNIATLTVDYTKPTVSGNTVGSNLKVANGAYVTSQVNVSAIDANFSYLWRKTPGMTTYTSSGNSSYMTDKTNGWYYFYATDRLGQRSDDYSFCIDNVGPKGQLYSNGVTVDSNSYVGGSFSYSATDETSGIKSVYYRSPNSDSYVPYSSGSIIPSNSGDGWYYFYALDNAGNMSEVKQIFLETGNPTVTIERNGNTAFTHSITKNETVNTGLYFNQDDIIRFDYSSSSNKYTTGKFDTGKNYALRQSSYPNSTYSETITTALGVTANYNFSIVRNKPTITLNGIRYEDGAVIHINKDADITMNIDSVITSGTNTGEISVDNKTTNYDLLTDKSVKLTALDNEVKSYSISSTDAADNTSTFDVIIDKQPAEGVFSSNGVIIENNGYTNKPFTFTWTKAGTTCTYTKDNGASKAYNSEEITGDGFYTFVLTDSVGNTSEYRITIDTVIPTGQLYADNKEVDDGIVTNNDIYFTWDGNDECLLNGESYKKNTIIDQEGVYTFVLKDKAGNKTSYTAEIDRTAPNGNEDALKASNRYSVSKWYEVDFKGKKEYFKDYATALSRAADLEFNDAVQVLELDDISKFTETNMVASNDNDENHDDEVRTGTYWQYKSIANSNIKLYYFDEVLLRQALNHYAKSYVSGPHYLDGNNKSEDANISDPYLIMDGVQAPNGNDYVLQNFESDTAYAIKRGTENKVSLVYGKTLGEQLTESGVYDITETDEAGNFCTYTIIIDHDKPSIQVHMETYGNTPVDMTIGENTLVSSNTYYLKNFSIQQIIDADPWAVVAVTKNGDTNYYTKEDTLPVLTEGGKYSIRVYDRTGNSIAFTVYISDKEENIIFTHNSDDTSMTVDINLTESNQTITSLEIYCNGQKLSGVSTNQLNYEFSKDGNYKVTLKDNFGRTIEKEYYFHKALPFGYLSGVENNGKTSSNVGFDYDPSKYNLEIFKNGQKISSDTTGHIDITAENQTSGDYEFVLINNTDDENRQVYKFTIDTIAPNVELEGVKDGETTNGSVMVRWNDTDVIKSAVSVDGMVPIDMFNGSTFSNEGFYVIEVVDDLGNTTTLTFTIDKTVEYEVKTTDGKRIGGDATTSDDVIISTNEEATITVIKDGQLYDYTFGDKLTEEGSYLITVQDAFGNKTSFTIVIDKSVSFNMTVADGGISNDPVTINPDEKVTITMTKDGDVYSYIPGTEITEEGFYKAIITDAYGNSKEVTFQIVSNNPKTVLDYELGDGVTITSITHDGEPIAHEGNHLTFESDGTYVICYEQDGKEYSFTLTLDTTAPKATLNGVEDGGKVDGKVTITDMTEEGEIHVYKDGEEISYQLGQELSDYGKYQVVLKDKLGNIRTYSFTLAYQMNGWGIALICIGVVTAIGLTIFIIKKKKKPFTVVSNGDDEEE